MVKLNIPKKDLPLIVLTNTVYSEEGWFWSLISAIIAALTDGPAHAMWMIWDNKLKRPVFASQDKYFEKQPLEKYLKKGTHLEFWQIKNLDEKERLKLIRAVHKDLNRPKDETTYDWAMSIGQGLATVTGRDRFKKIQNPAKYFCSEIMCYHLRKIGIFITKPLKGGKTTTLDHPSPADMKNCFMREKQDFRVYGWWSKDRGWQYGSS